jgi:Tol biopolymer transport system component
VDILDSKPAPLPRTGELSPELIRIVERALEKDRKRRYQSARELLADLQHLQRTPLVPVSGAVFIGEKKSGRLRAGLLAAGGVILSAMLVAWAFWWWGMHGKERVLGPNWFEFASTRRVTFEGDVASAVISPDGKYLAYVAGQGIGRLRLRNLNDGTESGRPQSPGNYVGLSFSPDSKTLYYVLRQGEMGRAFASPVAGFADTPSWILLENVDGPLTFSPTGNEFVFRRNTTERNHANNAILLGSEANPRNPQTLLSLAGTQIRDELAWSPKNDWIAAVTYPAHLNKPTRATVSLFDRKGRVLRSFVPKQVRSLYAPIALDGGSLLLFSGFPEGSVQRHLVQLFVPTGEFHEVATDLLGFESISVTSDSRTLASVRMDQRSSIWEADAHDLQHPRKRTRDTEPIPGVRWLSSGSGGEELVFPSSRTENQNLALLKEDGSVAALGAEKACVEEFPVGVPGRPLVVYASNCAHGGDDFNLWTLDRNTGGRRALTSGSSYDYQPDVSPDGKWIVYTSWSSDVASLWKIPVDGGIPETLSREQGKMPFFSPDGKRIIAQTRDPFGPWRVEVLDAEDGTVLRSFPSIPAGVFPVRWSPDGKALDYIARPHGRWGIWRQPLGNGKAHELLGMGEESINDFAWNSDGTKIAYVQSRVQRDVVLFHRK